MSSSLPTAPSLEHLKYQAKDLQTSVLASDTAALKRAAACHPARTPDPFQLSDSQFVIAREYGFASWPKLKAYIESISGPRASRFRPFHTDLSYYDDRSAGLVSMHASGLPSAMRQIIQFHPEFAELTEAEVGAAAFTQEQARLVTAREHGFDTWQKLRRQVKALANGMAFEPFLAAFRAIEANDFNTFESLIRRDASLINARGTNGNTLLNLATSCRRNEIVTLLLECGADVNLGNSRGSTPLHQAAYMGDCNFIRRFLEAGGDISISAHGDGGTPLFFAEFWGHREAADILGAQGVVPQNLRITSGLGRVDLMKGLFHDGALTADAGAHRAVYRPHSGFPVWHPSDSSREILDEAFVYAAKSGRFEAMEYLLEHGAEIDGDPYRGTALIWAAASNKTDVVAWLLKHGASVNLRATFGGPTHGQGVTALHLAAQNDYKEMAKLLVENGADPTITDDNYQSSAAGWASHFGHKELAEYLGSVQ